MLYRTDQCVSMTAVSCANRSQFKHKVGLGYHEVGNFMLW